MDVYLSGRVGSHPDGVEVARKQFEYWKRMLQPWFRKAWNPLDIPIRCQPDGPKCVEPDMPQGHTWGCALRSDLLFMLANCQAIFMIPDWEHSPGARLELMVASSCLLQVFHPADFGMAHVLRPGSL
jgi:Domain of unknown function (DUF4406)